MVLYRNTRLSTITQSTSIQVQYNESFLDSPNSSNRSPTKINVKKICSLSATYNGEMAHRKQQK